MLKMQLAFLSRSHVLKETSNHCGTDSGSGERWKACDSRIISAHDRIFSWFNRYITIIYWNDMTIAWERYCWCRTPKSWCFKSMFVSVFRCQITISDRHSGLLTHLSRRQKVEVRIMVKGKEAKLNIGSCGENGKSTWTVESTLILVMFLRCIWEMWTSEAFDVDFLLWGFIVNGSSVAHVSVISKVKTDRRYLNLRSFFFTRRWTSIPWRRQFR